MARQDRAERTRNTILDAAAAVFDERGFNGASLSDILDRAGMTKGALYFHFASKEELARAIIDEQWTFEVPPVSDNRDALQALIDLCHRVGCDLVTNIRASASNRLVTEANFASPERAIYDHWIDNAHQYLIGAQAAGDLREEWKPETVATWLAGSFLGVELMANVRTNRTDLRERITDLWRIALPGLVPPRRVARFNPAGTITWDTAA